MGIVAVVPLCAR